MASISEVMGGEKSGLTITRDIDPGWGFTFEATFDPTAIPADGSDIFDDSRTSDVVCQVVKSWDLTGPVPVSDIGSLKAGQLVKAGDPIPLEPEVVRRLPSPLLLGIVQGLVSASFPKSASTESKETLSE